MHSANLGVCQWLNASCFLLLQDHHVFGSGTLSEQLEILSHRFRAWAYINSIPHSQGHITAGVLHYSDVEYPVLTLKAWNGRVMTSYMAVTLQSLALQVPGNIELAMAAAACSSLSEWFLKLEIFGRYLTQNQADELHSLMMQLLASHVYLDLVVKYVYMCFDWLTPHPL